MALNADHRNIVMKALLFLPRHLVPQLQKLLYTSDKFAEEFSDLEWIRSTDLSVAFGFGFEGFSDNN